MSFASGASLYFAGWCPVCPGAGPLVLLAKRGSTALRVGQPGTVPPRTTDVFAILAELAPDSVKLISKETIRQLYSGPIEEIPYGDWMEFDGSTKDLGKTLSLNQRRRGRLTDRRATQKREKSYPRRLDQ